MLVLSRIDARVLETLKQHGPLAPTKLGVHLDFKYEDASASVQRPLNRLLKLNLIHRMATNKRVVTYGCNRVLPPYVVDGRLKPRPRSVVLDEATGLSLKAEKRMPPKIVTLLKELDDANC